MLSTMISHQAFLKMDGKNLNGKPFQIFGFDILLDKNYKAWILEINDHPSMNIFHNTEEKDYAYQQPKKEKEPSDEEEPIVSLVDLHVKTTVMADTLELALLKKS